MAFEWDPEKAAANFHKHGVRFSDGIPALADPSAITIRTVRRHDEERFITIGTEPAARVLVVVYTWRGENVRLISVRRANSRERRQYERRA